MHQTGRIELKERYYCAEIAVIELFYIKWWVNGFELNFEIWNQVHVVHMESLWAEKGCFKAIIGTRIQNFCD